MDFQHFDVHVEMEESHWWFLARRRILRTLIHELLPPSKKRIIMDIGCGTGANTAALAEGYTAIGIDPGADGIAFAKERFGHVHYICGRFPDAFTEKEVVPDLYLLTDVLEHSEDDSGFLNKIVQAMAPGSLILITVPADMSLWSQHDESVGHYRRYTTESLRDVWSNLPVEEQMCSYFNTRLYPIIRVVRTLNRLLKRTSGTKGTDFKIPPYPLNRLLQKIFAGESKILLKLLRRKRAKGFTYGASLITVLERV